MLGGDWSALSMADNFGGLPLPNHLPKGIEDRSSPSVRLGNVGLHLERMKILKTRLVGHCVGDHLSRSPPTRQVAIYLQFSLPGPEKRLTGNLRCGTKARTEHYGAI